MSYDCTMSIGSDNTLLVKGVYNTADSQWVNDATVSVTLLDLDGNEVEGQDWPTAMPYVEGSDGNYSCILHETIDVEDEQEVTAVVSILADGLERTLRLRLKFSTTTAVDLAWTSKDELERMFGRANIAQWADLENNESETDVLQQIQYAVDAATEDAKMRLLGSSVKVSALTCIPTPLRLATTQLAGVLLYNSRGVKDTSDEEGRNRLTYHKKQADTFFQRLRAGVTRLSVSSAASAPEAIVDESVES